MSRMDKEQRHARFWAFVRKKEQGIGPSMRFRFEEADSFELEVTNAPLWEQYRKEAADSDHPRDAYVFLCAERFGKKIQHSIDSYVERFGKEPDDKYLFNDIRSCKDFSFLLEDNTGRDVHKAVEWLAKTIKFGDKIKDWFDRDVAEIKKRQESKNDKNVYLQSGASSAPESEKERHARLEQNQRERHEDLLLRAFSKVTITGLAQEGRDPTDQIKMNLGIDFTKTANMGKNGSEFFVVQSEMQKGPKNSGLVDRISVELDPNAKLEDVIDGAMLLVEWSGVPVTLKVGKKDVVIKYKQDRLDILQQNPILAAHFKQEGKDFMSRPMKLRNSRYGFLNVLSATRTDPQGEGQKKPATPSQARTPTRAHPGFSSPN